MAQKVVRGFLILSCVVLFAYPLAAQSFTVTSYGQGSATPAAVTFALPDVEVTQISSGPSSTAANTCGINGVAVYTWYGLGDSSSALTTPTKANLPANVWLIHSVSAGAGHFLALTDFGVFAWGVNSLGQLGDGTTTNRPDPVPVQFPASVTYVSAISAGYFHSLAITNDGLYAWGHNSQGALGDGTFVDSPLPIKVTLPPSVTTINSIVAGDMNSFAVTNDGLYAWGYNFFGQLGDGTTVDRGTPVKITVQGAPKKVPVIVNSVAAGDHYTLALTSDGVYAWGENLRGSLGTKKLASSITPVKIDFPKVVTSVRSVAAGRIHSLAITNDGLYAWGDNSNGQLGLGAFTANSFVLEPVKVPGEANAIAADGGDTYTAVLH